MEYRPPWAQITWLFFHSFAEKVHVDFFNKHKSDCLGLIKYVCHNLPCPNCKAHAIKYMEKVNIYNCETKEDLIKYIWVFHNNVNARLQKKEYPFERLAMYKNAVFPKIFNKFIYEFKRPYYYGKTMNAWTRQTASKKLVFYFKHYMKYFI